MYNNSFTCQSTLADDSAGQVLMHLVQHGTWRFTPPDERGETVTVRAGSFIARHNGPPSSFDVDPGATAKGLILPAWLLPQLSGGWPIVGSA